MAAAAKVAGAAHGHLKIKLGAGGDDLARLRAIRDAVPDARLIADVNAAWTIDMLVASLPELAALGIEMLEQPLPAGQDAALAEIARLLPIGADADRKSVVYGKSWSVRVDLGCLRLIQQKK